MAQIQQSLSAYSNIGLWSTSGSESVHQKATLPSLKGSRVCQSQSSGSSEETFIIIGSPVYGNSVSHSQELTTVCYRVPVHDSHDKLIKSMQYLFCDLCFFPLLDCVALKKERKKTSEKTMYDTESQNKITPMLSVTTLSIFKETTDNQHEMISKLSLQNPLIHNVCF